MGTAWLPFAYSCWSCYCFSTERVFILCEEAEEGPLKGSKLDLASQAQSRPARKKRGHDLQL